jgi:hypothetical protein
VAFFAITEYEDVLRRNDDMLHACRLHRKSPNDYVKTQSGTAGSTPCLRPLVKLSAKKPVFSYHFVATACGISLYCKIIFFVGKMFVKVLSGEN